MPGHVNIEHLADLPEAIPVLAQWFIEAWEPYYGAQGPGEAEQDLTACCNRDGLPTALVALDAENHVLGTAALKAQSLESHRHLRPWLAALLVSRDRRGAGVGSALVAAIEEEARRQGFSCLYTGASASSGLLRRRGWEPMEEGVPTLRQPATIFRRQLGRN